MKPRRWALRALVVFVVFALGGFFVALSGIVPIAASGGHWGITEWVLQFGKRRAIATHTIGLELPPLDAPWLVAKGAGAYETGCRPCHGSPGHERPRIAAAMLPPPPYLPPLVAERDPEALFYVIKHGIKFTGMPAWPSQERDDEVHAMVAFLRAFPADADGYRRLVFGDPARTASLGELSAGAPLASVVASCERCHGRDTPASPKLAGQKREYLINALAAYQQGRRHSGIMEPIAAALDAEQQRALADHYSRMPPHANERAGADPRVERGRIIASEGIPSRDVPACHDCHGPSARPRNAAYPHLAGQFPEYLVLQLEIFQRDQRGGSAYAHLMKRVAKGLTREQMRDVAAYYGSLPAQPVQE